MSARSFFDTNVLLYRDDLSDAEKRGRANELIAEHWRSGTAVISTQVMQEYFVAATRKLGVAADTARRRVELLEGLNVVPIQTQHILAAIDLHRLHAFSFWDALILTAAQVSGCSVLLSEDMQNGQRFGDVLIRNPFV